MRSPLRLLLPALTLATVTTRAAITVPGADGSDGALNITADTVIDLGLATSGNGTTVKWDTNNAANAGNGIYDPSKWAVVFKYSSVNIAAGKTLSFKNNASRAPVVWLVNGNVTVDGTLSVNGREFQRGPYLAEPGPGGFRGGTGTFRATTFQGAGFGVGGGAQNRNGGSYGGLGLGGHASYGNPSLVPLIGGSGGGGISISDAGGGAGGGAILIASRNSISLTGSLQAYGGTGDPYAYVTTSGSGGGSGGGIRLVSESLLGTGTINAGGGAGGANGGPGRIRIERVANTNTISVAPDPSIIDLPTNATALLWPPSGAPEVKVISIGGVSAPADPKSGFGTIGADVALPNTNSTTVIVETTNVEPASVVKVRITPRSNANYVEVNANTPPTLVSGTTYRWTATFAPANNAPVQVGYSAVQARVIRP